MQFRIFDNPLAGINEEDLKTQLDGVSEGWFVEYKSEKPIPKAIAKAISGFANSHGGYLIIGVQADKESNEPIDYPGVSLDCDYFHDCLRGNLSHIPYFKVCKVSLKNGKAVYIVEIPEGQDTPYIHSSGRIYRRQESSSDPVKITEKVYLEDLYKRKEKTEKQKNDFRSIDYGFCVGEKEVPFLAVYVNGEPFKQRGIVEHWDRDEIRRVKNHFNRNLNINDREMDLKLQGHIPFDDITFYPESITLRSLTNQNLAYNNLTIELDVWANLKMLIPLSGHNASTNESMQEDEQIQKFMNYLKKRSIGIPINTRFIRLEQIFSTIFVMFSKYFTYLQNKDFVNKLQFSFATFNCHRTLAFSNTDTFFSHIEEFGLPYVIKSQQYYPKDPNSISFEDIYKSLNKSIILLTMEAISVLGIPNMDTIRMWTDQYSIHK